MENRFAGAQDLGHRRRRRLSGGEPDDAILREFFPAEAPHVSASPPFADIDSHSSQLLRRLISPRTWKHICLLIALLIIVSTVIWWEHSRPVMFDDDGNTTLTRGITGLLLLLTGQLAFLIGWIRSQSAVDFRGRYRWWKWLAAGLVAGGIVLVTRTQVLVPDLMTWLVESVTGPIRAARPAVVLVPGLLFCVAVVGRVLPDMRRCFSSQSLLVVALLTMTVRLMLVHSSSPASIQPATLNAMLLGSAWLSFAAMLLHCRFVAFVCNDPPIDPEQPKRVESPNVARKPRRIQQPEQVVVPGESPKTVGKEEPASKPAPRKKSRRSRKSQPGESQPGESRKAA